MAFFSGKTEEEKDKTAQIVFDIDENGNKLNSPSKEETDTFLTVGQFCSHPECRREDYLPVECSHCNKTFCNSHYEVSNHECTYKENDKTLPQCPICNQYVLVPTYMLPDALVNEHISSGCKLHVAVKEMEKKEKLRRKELRCGVKMCANHLKQQYSTMICEDCGLKVCLSHRLGFDHGCDEHKAKRQAEMREARIREMENGGLGVKVKNATSNLLAKLRGKREAKETASTQGGRVGGGRQIMRNN